MFVKEFFAKLRIKTKEPIDWIDVAETGFNDLGAKELVTVLRDLKPFKEEVYLDLMVY